MFVLQIRVPGEAPRRLRLDRAILTLGRASTNDIPLADRTLSRVHARLEQENGGYRIVDLGSRNGTALNGARLVVPAVLKPGDCIRLGETTIEVGHESTTRVVIEGEASSSSEHTVFRASDVLMRTHREDAEALGQEELARLNASLRILNEVSIALLSDLPLDGLLNLVLEKLFSILSPDRGLLMLAGENGELSPAAVKFADGVDPSDIRLSKTLVQAVVDRKNGVLLIDTETDIKLGNAESIRLQGITSCLAAPLFVDEKVIGLVYLEARLGRKSFTEDDLRLLTSLANVAAIKIQNVGLQEEAAAKQSIEREMVLAWEIQRRLLPERAPDIPGATLTGRTVPSRTVSGDYYDFFVRGDGTLDVVVADVCGKGMGASILAASVQAAYEAWASENFPPDRICARLNDLIYRRTSPEKFVTFILAHYDPETGAVVFTNAGHNPGLLIRTDGQCEKLGAHGPPLGLFPGLPYSSGSFTMNPGDVLVLYTDGVTEAANAEDQEFGMERLRSIACASRGKPLADVETDITNALTDFTAGTPYGDDRTLVLLRRD